MSLRLRIKPRKAPHTKSSIIKKARRFLKKWHPTYKVTRADYDNEHSVWFARITENSTKKIGLIEYGYSGTFIRIELDGQARAPKNAIPKKKASFIPANWKPKFNSNPNKCLVTKVSPKVWKTKLVKK